MSDRALPRLYDPAFEHDSCGFGLVAQIEGRASGWVVDTAFEALAKLSHRGGVSGDGCGVLIHRPQPWLRALAKQAGVALGERFAAGLVFLDRENQADGDAACATLKRCLVEEGLAPAGWREVEVNPDACGPMAAAARPRVRQLFVEPADGAVGGAMDEESFERALFRGRRRAELALHENEHFYVVSLSAQVIGYKAITCARRPACRVRRPAAPGAGHRRDHVPSTFFHQHPQWRLAQPFRMLAHNGEINTIRANRRWM